MVEVGEVVLLRIDPEIQRPLLVTHVDEAEGKVDGELFLSWRHDRGSVWCAAHCFYLPAKDQRQMEVLSVDFGPEVGQWQPRVEGPKRGKVLIQKVDKEEGFAG